MLQPRMAGVRSTRESRIWEWERTSRGKRRNVRAGPGPLAAEGIPGAVRGSVEGGGRQPTKHTHTHTHTQACLHDLYIFTPVGQGSVWGGSLVYQETKSHQIFPSVRNPKFEILNWTCRGLCEIRRKQIFGTRQTGSCRRAPRHHRQLQRRRAHIAFRGSGVHGRAQAANSGGYNLRDRK